MDGTHTKRNENNTIIFHSHPCFFLTVFPLQDLPAITVELLTHDGLDWFQNLAGLQTILAFYR
ncbi:MAG: hypothetical protein KA314_28985 [Chloroflexi bacterium]|nr:hypothetical protein [Chloroflexota bacterium]MBP8059893.1 hypothetical protein [Chloroflexota bacterium]